MHSPQEQAAQTFANANKLFPLLSFILIDSASIFVSVNPLKQNPIELNKNAIITPAKLFEIIINTK